MLDAALAAILRDWPVFPLRPGDKRPAVDHWEERATTDLDRICDYWEKHPHANVAVATGPARLLVVDLDTKGGVDGIATFAVISPAHELPVTYTVETPSGGLHLYFATTDDHRNTAGKLGPGIDTRGRGGFVVAAGSTTPTGPYRTIVDLEPIALPGWLTRRLTDKPHVTPSAPASPRWGQDRRNPNYTGLIASVATAANGTRNSTLHWAACRLADDRLRGEPIADALDELHQAAVAAGLTATEATATIRSALRQAGL
jgi:hypothetical protein